MFLQACQDMQALTTDKDSKAESFINDQLAPNVDARLFEIVSYSILKYHYHDQKIFWGYEFKLGQWSKVR